MKIIIFSSSRADFDLLFPIFRSFMNLPNVETLMIVEKNLHTAKLDIFLTPQHRIVYFKHITKSSHVIITKFAFLCQKFFHRFKPDLLIVLGDRFETLTICQMAILYKVPIAHLAGGEITNGSVDEYFRHAISKLSNLHFVTHKIYKKRLIQLGENPKNIWVTLPLGLSTYDKSLNQNIFKDLQIPENFEKYALITLHPETMRNDPEFQAQELLIALSKHKNLFCIFTESNQDPGGAEINKMLKTYVNSNSNSSKMFSTLGQKKYFELIHKSHFIIGNSSSIYTEARKFKIHCVEIGSRQIGRIKHKNIHHVEFDSKKISTLISKLMLQTPKTPIKFRNQNVSDLIAESIVKTDLKTLNPKIFKDIKF